MKTQTTYHCQKCDFTSSRWLGKCPSCSAWNSFVEKVVTKESKKLTSFPREMVQPLGLQAYQKNSRRLIKTGLSELDNVLGGGFSPGGVFLLGGEPGIGKSTLVAQITDKITEQALEVFYFSGEETAEQVLERMTRLGLKSTKIKVAHENNLENILAALEVYQPDFVVVDSIQTVSSENLPNQSGSVAQVRNTTETLLQYAKRQRKTLLLIGQITKGGDLAGPKTVEHLVDAVLFLEGEERQSIRILRGIKNRFGATDEVGIFTMTEKGLEEVKNPGGAFLEAVGQPKIGAAITAAREGSRPFLLEIQTLTNFTKFGYPKRLAAGVDSRRLDLTLAVLAKYTKIKLDTFDVYASVMGGLSVKEPAADLALAASLCSSRLNKPLPIQTLFLGEISLTGEIRPVQDLEKRLQVAEKLGFKQVFLPKSSKVKTKLQVVEIWGIRELAEKLE